MQNDKAIKENPYVCKAVLDQVGTPSGYLFSKALALSKFSLLASTTIHLKG